MVDLSFDTSRYPADGSMTLLVRTNETEIAAVILGPTTTVTASSPRDGVLVVHGAGVLDQAGFVRELPIT